MAQAAQAFEMPVNGAGMPILPGETPGTTNSDDWSLDLLEGADFDWNAFLTSDISGLDGGAFGFAPDGLM